MRSRAPLPPQSLALWPRRPQRKHLTGSLQVAAKWPPAKQRRHLSFKLAGMEVLRLRGALVVGRREGSRVLNSGRRHQWLGSTVDHPSSSAADGDADRLRMLLLLEPESWEGAAPLRCVRPPVAAREPYPPSAAVAEGDLMQDLVGSGWEWEQMLMQPQRGQGETYPFCAVGDIAGGVLRRQRLRGELQRLRRRSI